MARIVQYDSQGRVTNYLPQADEARFQESSDTLINPNLDAVSGIANFRYWKVVEGAVLPMSDVERYKLDNSGVQRNSSLVEFKADGEIRNSAPILKEVQMYVIGKVTLYSMKSIQEFSFNLSKGASEEFTIDGERVTLFLSKTGTLSISKAFRYRIKYQIEAKYI